MTPLIHTVLVSTVLVWLVFIIVDFIVYHTQLRLFFKYKLWRLNTDLHEVVVCEDGNVRIRLGDSHYHVDEDGDITQIATIGMHGLPTLTVYRIITIATPIWEVPLTPYVMSRWIIRRWLGPVIDDVAALNTL